jgi:uroporphyrinogen-III synthase
MILITRPMPEATDTATWLQAKGFETWVDSQLVIEPVVCEPVEGNFNVALFTSGNGVRHVPPEMLHRQPLVLTVGGATADMAKARGFKSVLSACGDVGSLYELCLNTLDPAWDRLTHFAGVTTIGHLAGRLVSAGFQAQEKVVYVARAKDTLSGQTQLYIQQGRIRSALFFSPKTATVFMENLNRYGLMQDLSPITAFCMSSAVADQLSHASWSGIKIADKPTQAALLNLLNSEN